MEFARNGIRKEWNLQGMGIQRLRLLLFTYDKELEWNQLLITKIPFSILEVIITIFYFLLLAYSFCFHKSIVMLHANQEEVVRSAIVW